MNLSINSRASGPQLPPERLAKAEGISHDQKLDELARQFEAVLLRKIITESQKPLLGPGMMSTSGPNGVYQDLMVSRLADDLAHTNSFGLAESLKAQLTRQNTVQKP